MTLRHGPTGTLDPGLLVDLIDDELGPGARADIRDHLAGCPACRDALEAMERRSRAATGVLERTDPDPPTAAEWTHMRERIRSLDRGHAAHSDRGTRATPRFRRAAGWFLALVAAGALASSPVRAWIASGWSALIADEPATGAASPAATYETSPGAAGLTFETAGPELLLVFEEAPSGGALRVRFTEAGTATMRVSGGGAERLTVGRRGVRIAGAGGAAASYDLDVPGPVRRVTVRIGAGKAMNGPGMGPDGSRELTVTRSGHGAAGAIIDLGEGRVRNAPGDDDE